MNGIESAVVLLVEDDIDVRQYWEIYLRHYFLDVISASTGVEALEILQKETVDIIISDVLMPDLDGFELCKRVKSHKSYSHIPVILMSSKFNRDQDQEIAKKYSAAALLNKNIDPHALLDTATDALIEAKRNRSKKHSNVVQLNNQSPNPHHKAIINKLIETISEIDHQRERNQILAERFRDFASCITDSFWEIDHNFIITYFCPSNSGRANFLSKKDLQSNLLTLLTKRFDIPQTMNLRETFKQSNKIEFILSYQDMTAIKHVQVNAVPFYNSYRDFSGYRGCFSDITEHQRNITNLEYEVNHDSLTGSLNNRGLDVAVQSIFAKAPSHGSHHTACYFDIDNFKNINDQLGHFTGNNALILLTDTIKSSIRQSDCLARVGGDEFMLVLQSCPISKVDDILLEIQKNIANIRLAEDMPFQVSIGVASVSEESFTENSYEQLQKASDKACYTAKNNGKNQVCYHDHSHNTLYSTKKGTNVQSSS